MEKVVSSSIKGKASDAVFFTLFFSAVYFLLLRWREKIRTSTPLHLVTLSEMAAIITFLASFIYLFGFLVQSLIVSPSGEDEEDEFEHLMVKEDSQAMPCGAQLELDHLKINNQKSDTDDLKIKTKKSESIIEEPLSEADEEIVKSVVEGKIPSYALESKLGDCRRAAAIRREALQRTTGKSLEGLPLEGFDYESILGQCCEMPVGYVQIPVGIAGPLLLDGKEFSVPMATTEGCLVASTNRGCKAIHASGGATSSLFRDAMTRAPVVRFATAKRAAQLKMFLED